VSFIFGGTENTFVLSETEEIAFIEALNMVITAAIERPIAPIDPIQIDRVLVDFENTYRDASWVSSYIANNQCAATCAPRHTGNIGLSGIMHNIILNFETEIRQNNPMRRAESTPQFDNSVADTTTATNNYYMTFNILNPHASYEGVLEEIKSVVTDALDAACSDSCE